MLKKLTIIIVFLLILAGCSKEQQNVHYKTTNFGEFTYQIIEIDYNTLSSEDKKRLGIELKYSPDSKYYFYTDKTSPFEFRKIFLVDDEGEREIFDFQTFFSEAHIRDMEPIFPFWGGNSDRIYLYHPHSEGGPWYKLYYYSIENKEWIENNILPNKVDFVIQQNYTDNLIYLAEDGYHYLLNTITQNTDRIEGIPRESTIIDQKDHEIIVWTDGKNGIYDFSSKSFNFLTQPSNHIPYPYFLPNTESKIYYSVYIIPPKDGLGLPYYFLAIHDFKTNIINLIPFDGDLMGWDNSGKCAYGSKILLCFN